MKSWLPDVYALEEGVMFTPVGSAVVLGIPKNVHALAWGSADNVTLRWDTVNGFTTPATQDRIHKQEADIRILRGIISDFVSMHNLHEIDPALISAQANAGSAEAQLAYRCLLALAGSAEAVKEKFDVTKNSR